MRKFDTKVQHLKYKVLREVARLAWTDSLLDKIMDVPKTIVPGNEPTMRCCVYKERAILAERVKLAMGGDKNNPNIIEVIDIACDECPVSGYLVSSDCRGCIAHRCQEACPRDAIYFDENQKARIDKSKCIECGRCVDVCPMELKPLHYFKLAGAQDWQGCKDMNIMDCMECRCCEYICSSKLPLVTMIKMGKNGVRGLK